MHGCKVFFLQGAGATRSWGKASARIGCSFIHSGSAYHGTMVRATPYGWSALDFANLDEFAILSRSRDPRRCSSCGHMPMCHGPRPVYKILSLRICCSAVAEAEASADLHNSRSRIRGRGAATLGGCRRSAICPLLLLIHVLRTRRFIRSYVSSCHMYTRVRMCMYSKIRTSDSPQHTGQCAISHAPCTLPHALHHSRHAPPPCSKGAGTTTRRPSSYG